jgi:hypothetical protein
MIAIFLPLSSSDISVLRSVVLSVFRAATRLDRG